MTEEEIMIRAREASIKFGALADTPEGVRNGSTDDAVRIRVAAIALRDLSKPLSEIQPVDPDLIEAREVVCAYHHDKHPESPWHVGQAGLVRSGSQDRMLNVQAAYAGIKRGRELERNQ